MASAASEIERLVSGLARLPPREVQLLWHRVVRGASAETVAAFYGVAKESLDLSSLRAVRGWAAACGRSSEAGTTAGSPEEEWAAARALAEQLDHGAAARSAHPVLRFAAEAVAARDELARRLSAQLEAAERAEDSPLWLRLLIAAGLIGAAIWLSR